MKIYTNKTINPFAEFVGKDVWVKVRGSYYPFYAKILSVTDSEITYAPLPDSATQLIEYSDTDDLQELSEVNYLILATDYSNISEICNIDDLVLCEPLSVCSPLDILQALADSEYVEEYGDVDFGDYE